MSRRRGVAGRGFSPAWAQTCVGMGGAFSCPGGCRRAGSPRPGVAGGACCTPTCSQPTLGPPASHEHTWQGGREVVHLGPEDTKSRPGWAREMDCMGPPPAPKGTGGPQCQAQPPASCLPHPRPATTAALGTPGSAPSPPLSLSALGTTCPLVSTVLTSPWHGSPVTVSWGHSPVPFPAGPGALSPL